MLKKTFLCNKHTICIQITILCSVFFCFFFLLHTPFHLSASCAKLARQQFTLCVSLRCQLSFHLKTIFNHCQHLYSTPLYRKNQYLPILSTFLHTNWLCVLLRNVQYYLPQSPEFIIPKLSVVSYAKPYSPNPPIKFSLCQVQFEMSSHATSVSPKALSTSSS